MRTRGVAVCLAFLLAACEAGGSSTVAPSVAPTGAAPQGPTPSAVPPEVVLERFEAFSDAGTSEIHARMDLRMSYVTGSGEETAFTIAGDIDAGSGNVAAEMNGTLPGPSGVVASHSSSRYVGDRAYTRRDDGPWLSEDRDDASTNDPLSWFKAKDLRADGTTTRDGALLYRFTGDASAAFAQFTSTEGTDIRDVRGTVLVLSDVEGRPIEISIDVVVDAVTPSTSLHMVITGTSRYSEYDQPHVIEPPPEFWLEHASKVDHFTMAYPSTWTVRYEAGATRFIAPDDASEMRVFRSEVRYDMTQAAWLDETLAYYRDRFGQEPDAATAVTVAGVETQLLEYHLGHGGRDVFIDVPVKPESEAFDIQWFGGPEDAAEGRRVLTMALTTLEIDEP